MRERAGVVAILGVLGCLLLDVCSACLRPASPSATAVLETMRQLTVAQVLTKDAIEKALEADLVIDAGKSSDMVTFHLGRSRSGSRF